MIRNLVVRDTIIDPYLDPAGDRELQVDSSGDMPLYRVWLLLEGPDLPYVQSATYLLHRTFPNPRREVKRTPSNPNCALVIWTWGIFAVQVSVRDKKGDLYKFSHRLRYDKQLQEGDFRVVQV